MMENWNKEKASMPKDDPVGEYLKECNKWLNSSRLAEYPAAQTALLTIRLIGINLQKHSPTRKQRCTRNCDDPVAT